MHKKSRFHERKLRSELQKMLRLAHLVWFIITHKREVFNHMANEKGKRNKQRSKKSKDWSHLGLMRIRSLVFCKYNLVNTSNEVFCITRLIPASLSFNCWVLERLSMTFTPNGKRLSEIRALPKMEEPRLILANFCPVSSIYQETSQRNETS